jgi:hypothetical protein
MDALITMLVILVGADFYILSFVAHDSIRPWSFFMLD